MRVLVISGSRARLPDPVYPLGAAIIGTVVRNGGHQVDWFDSLRHEDPSSALADKILEFDPEVFLVSIRNIDSGAFPNPELHFEDHGPLIECCRQNSKAKIITGGSGFSLMPDAFMDRLGPDIGVVGEGETIIDSILKQIEDGNPPTGIVRAERSSKALPVAARDLFDANWYYLHGGVANLQTKRGCGFKCIYCSYPILEGDASRKADPKTVVDEMEEIKGQGIRDFFFVDAVFNRPESHAASVCEEIVRRDLDITFTAYFAPKGDVPEFPALLKRAGCNAAEFGTDSFSDPVLERMKKGFTAEQALDFSKRIAEVEIPQCHNLILGGPGETNETMEESVAILDEIDPRAVIVTIGLRVYPGTELEQIARAEGDDVADRANGLEPVFYVAKEVSDTVIEKASNWVDTRRGWICPGLGKRYNLRYLTRQRETRGRKGVLWTLF